VFKGAKMVGSVNTNIGAQIALRNLNVTGADLSSVQKKISTGLRVSDANDNGAVFAIAQGLRSDVSAVSTVNGQLSAAQGLLKVSNAAMTGISNALSDVRNVLVQLADQNVTGNSRAQLNAQHGTLISAVQNYIDGANYNDTNILKFYNGSGYSNTTSVIKDLDANQFTIGIYDPDLSPIQPTGALAFGSGLANITGANPDGSAIYSTSAPADATSAASILANGIIGAQDYVGTALNYLAAQAKFIDNQLTFNSAISDATAQGLGALVDADLAKESARLQSLQIKQQLGTQSLGIANQAPQSLLGLFR